MSNFSDIEQARSNALSMARESAYIKKELEQNISNDKKLLKGRVSMLKSSISLALMHRRRIADGDFSVFIFPFAMALAKDGILDLIPFLGKFVGIFVTAYLFIFLFGRGTWKWKVVRSFLLLFDALIPFLSMLPFTTFCVFVTYHSAKKDAEESKKALQ